MSTANRIFVEISPHSLQLAVMAGRRLVACGDYSLEDKEALASFIATHEVKTVDVALVSPRQPFARLAGTEAGSVRSEEGLLACAQAMSAGLAAPLSAAACDAATGKPVDPAGHEQWLLAGTTTEGLTAARDQLTALGLPAPALTGLALPAQLGAVVAALQDMPEATRVAVLALGENDSVLGLVSAGGVEAVRPVAVGYTQIYDAVQAELGLKFRAAAPKLFFNAAYDFGDAAEGIGTRLAVAVQEALAGFSDRPAMLHVVGLPEKQAWLGGALGKALGLAGWAPDAGKICTQLEMEVSAGITPTANVLRLIQLAAANDATKAAWLPYCLGDRPKPAPAPAAPVASAPAPAVVPVPPKPVVPPPAKAPVASAKPATPPPVRPAPKPVAKPEAKPAAAPVAKPVQAAKPAPAPAKPPVAVTPPAAKVVPPVPVEPVVAAAADAPHPEVPVKAADHPVLVPASPKRSWGLYGVIAMVVIVATVVSVKFYLDGRKQAKELAAREAVDNERKQAVARAEASLKVDPVTGLPGSWLAADIGSGTTAGTAAFKQAEFRLKGYGRDIGTLKDSFLFTYFPMSGDGVITVRVISLTGATRIAKAGLTMRSALTENASHVSLLLENGGASLNVVWRDKTGAKTAVINSTGDTVMSVPVWLRLVRAGNTITAYHSDNGRAWRLVAGTPLTVEMSGPIFAGLAVCSREDEPTQTTFDHVSVPGWESAPPVLSGGE